MSINSDKTIYNCVNHGWDSNDAICPLCTNLVLRSELQAAYLKIAQLEGTTSPTPKSNIKITIGMPSYNNHTEVWFTVQSLRLNQDLTDCEILIVDNYGDKDLEAFVRDWGSGNVRYVLSKDIAGTAAAKNFVFDNAQGEWVLCMDSHVLLKPGTIATLKEFIKVNQDCNDLLQGPLLHDSMQGKADSFSDVWSSGMWGQWSLMEGTKTEPYEIPMMGMGLFFSKRNSWMGFNREFRGFGGEEGYIHEKYRKHGRRTICLPWLEWMHYFRPSSVKVPHPARHEDKIRNYTIGFLELGLDLAPLKEHFGVAEVAKYTNLS